MLEDHCITFGSHHRNTINAKLAHRLTVDEQRMRVGIGRGIQFLPTHSLEQMLGEGFGLWQVISDLRYCVF